MPQNLQRKAALPRHKAGAPEGMSLSVGDDDFLVVGIGASAGGLDACRKLIAALPEPCGMSFILIQHLDPSHESMMVDLLKGYTSMAVIQAADGMPIERERLYVIAPGTYLSVVDRRLRVSLPEARHGARLPFDFLLRSLAKDFGARAVAVILSGTGADGSVGLKALEESGGFIVAQEPKEAGYAGMPSSAIDTCLVDLVLPASEIAEALAARATRAVSKEPPTNTDSSGHARDPLADVIDLLREKTVHDFTSYKTGTLQRRVERRMAMAGISAEEMSRYSGFLRTDTNEIDLLAKDLLINVTRFFRDPEAFDLLAETIIPDLVANQPPDRALRVWAAGCSTGEEAYSLAILFREEIASTKRNVKLQVFASDLDPDAIAIAREGVYSGAIAAEVTSSRLARFFTKENQGYRVSTDLRACVVFTVQDVLTDPPFARLDLISCRNLLIYLLPEAQAKVVAIFHFALRNGGFLLLGSSETAGADEGRFAEIAKPQRLYRHIGQDRAGDTLRFAGSASGATTPRRRGLEAGSRPLDVAEISRRRVLESYAPAAALIDRKGECLYFLGPIGGYLKAVSGLPVNDLVGMARDEVRSKLRPAIRRAREENARVVVPDCRIDRDGFTFSFKIAVQPLPADGDGLMLVCFFDEQKLNRGELPRESTSSASRFGEFEQELLATRAELQVALRDLEVAHEEQRAINEEASSANEEYQATNEEMLASKEELQSLNEELTALNGQLHETLDRQRTTTNDMQNVLYSTDVATIFLDTDLKIRSFTPATRLLFNVIPGDVGRPLADLKSLTADDVLIKDAQKVLETHSPVELEVEAPTGACYTRRVLPYRTQDDGVEGVVITFTDITDRRHAADALEATKRQAQLATLAKSRFLAAASHDLRQPLQTLALLHALLVRSVEGEKAQTLLARLEETLGSMSGMLNKLLDINEIEAGTVQADKVVFPINELLDRMGAECAIQAEAQNLSFRTVACSLWVNTDPGLLEQMTRNLLLNALKYTKEGGVVLGCRRHKDVLSLEIWDTGIGIPEVEFQSIFDEYHQLGNPARERGLGLGLGLSIVQRLGILLGHRVSVRSRLHRGSVFAIEIPLAPAGGVVSAKPEAAQPALPKQRRTGVVLLIEDDPELRPLLEILLKEEGHRVVTATDGAAALDTMSRGPIRPDIILTDYNLPNGMDGLQVAAKLQEMLHRELPVVVLTGDISTSALGHIAEQKCIQLNKPVRPVELMRIIQNLLPQQPIAALSPVLRESSADDEPEPPVVFIVDDDAGVRGAFRSLFEDDGTAVEAYESCEEFLAAYRQGQKGCLLIDAYLPGMSGLELLRCLEQDGQRLPAIMITGDSDVTIAVEAMKAGASDFIEKPVGREELLASVERALEQSRDSTKLFAWRQEALRRVGLLTSRQLEIMQMVLAGHPSKNIAADLGISQRTVESHRGEIMRRTESKSVPALARLALAAADARPTH